LKYLKYLKKKKIRNLKLVEESSANKDPLSLYYKFLKALSSRATLVLLEFGKLDI